MRGQFWPVSVTMTGYKKVSNRFRKKNPNTNDTNLT